MPQNTIIEAPRGKPLGIENFYMEVAPQAAGN